MEFFIFSCEFRILSYTWVAVVWSLNWVSAIVTSKPDQQKVSHITCSCLQRSCDSLDVPVRQEWRAQINSSCCLWKKEREIDESGFVRNLPSLFFLPLLLSLSLPVITKLNWTATENASSSLALNKRTQVACTDSLEILIHAYRHVYTHTLCLWPETMALSEDLFPVS